MVPAAHSVLMASVRAHPLATLTLTTTVVGGAVVASAYFWLRHKARQDFVPVARLANIVIHPIKSIVGVEVPYADCTVAGPVYKGLKDRHIQLVKGDYFLSMREEPRLGMIKLSFDEEKMTLTLTADGYPPLVVGACDPEERSKPSFTVRVRKFNYNAVEVSEEASQWFRNYLKCDDVRLVRVLLDQKTINRGCTGAAPVAFQDESAFHIISKASLEKLQSKLPPEADVRRRNFRPSLFVEGCDAHSEDHWLRYKIGEAEMAFLERTTRCVMTTVNQDTGIKTNKEPLVTLRKYRVDRSELGLKKYQSKPLLGIGSIHVKDGRIAVGDEVYAVLSPTPLL